MVIQHADQTSRSVIGIGWADNTRYKTVAAAVKFMVMLHCAPCQRKIASVLRIDASAIRNGPDAIGSGIAASCAESFSDTACLLVAVRVASRPLNTNIR